jgi:hypothetical protein
MLQERAGQQVKWCLIFTSDQYYCGLGVVKKVGTQESVEPIQQLRINENTVECLPVIRFASTCTMVRLTSATLEKTDRAVSLGEVNC